MAINKPGSQSYEGSGYLDEEAKRVQREQAVDTAIENRRMPLIKDKDARAKLELPYEPIGIDEPDRIKEADETVKVNSMQDALVESEKEGDLSPLRKALGRVGVLNPQTNQITTDEGFIDEKLNLEVGTQDERKAQATPATYQAMTGSQMKKTLPHAAADKDVYDNVVAFGANQTDLLSRQLRPVLSSTEETSLDIGDFLANNNLFDMEKEQVTPNVGNAIAISFLETAEDIYNKTDDAIETDVFRDSPGDGIFDPALMRERVVGKVVDKLVENPNISTVDPRLRTGYGGASKTMKPTVRSALEGIVYESLYSAGLFDVIDLNKFENTDLKDERLILSEEGEAFFLANRDILSDIQEDKRVNVGYLPTLVQGIPGAERELGDKAKAISKRSKSSKNTIFEDAVKMRLGSMPLKIDKESARYAQLMVDQEITLDERGVTQLLNPSTTGELYSTGNWAATLGLDKAKYIEFYSNALKRYQNSPVKEFKAREQADRIMRMRMRHIYRTMNDVAKNSDKIFYNKWFHASSVGRYFIRNTVLNSQNEKLVRNMVRSGKRTRVNLKGNPDKRTLDNWTYIIGRNLLDPDTDYNVTNGVKPEDMGWQSIINTTKKIINDPQYRKIYDAWYRKGIQLRTALNDSNPQTAMETFNAATLTGIHSKAFKKKDDWGYKMQSYIDFANYVDAKKPESNGEFEMRAMVQHDGKQNGIAIQAMQLGDIDTLELVGMVYADENNIIAQGDIRDKFLTESMFNLGTTFASNQPKEKFWRDFLQYIDEQPVETRSTLIKDLSKVPLMETSYGMPAEFHIETALAFLESDKGQEALINAKTLNSDLKDMDDIEMSADLNRIIGSGLNAVLKLKQQELYKKAGMLYAMMGGDVVLKGPLGTDIYMGANEHVKTGQTITVENLSEAGFRQIELTESRYSGSAPKKIRRRIYNKETGKYEREPRSLFGKLASNQLPVLTVQQIDAAVMANTIMKVNEERMKQRVPDPLFMIPIHDAIITDATSVDLYHREINNQFREINMKYSISKSIINGLENAKNALKERASRSPGKLFKVDYDSEFRALHDYLFMLNQKSEGYTDFPTATGEIIQIKEQLSSFQASLLSVARNSGWNPEGGDVPISVIYELIDRIMKKQRVLADLRQNHINNEANKKRIWSLISRRPYQYN